MEGVNLPNHHPPWCCDSSHIVLKCQLHTSLLV